MMIIRLVIGLFVVIVSSLHGKLMKHKLVRRRCRLIACDARLLRKDSRRIHCGEADAEAAAGVA
ncbi:hypothetical protein [Paraburkholderia franconis]|uniref:hypothetical protein n=1 Tax=Paraburkholderia franconis TaxID=2654983 RepID=UPI00187B56FD|nr:hypothetical protein [Paraburkholderia franconis]